MTIAIQTTLFDYAALDSETRIVVQQRTTEIKALMKRAASDIIEIGQKLIDVKARLPHGAYGEWLRSEFEWDQTTAWRFMNVANKFCKLQNIEIAPSALYLLAAPSTPESARQEAIDRAEQGEQITHAAAREMVSNHRNATPPRTDEDDEEPLTPYEQEIANQIEARRYDGWPMDTPPDKETQRRQQIAVITGSSESNEWYTPTHIIERAREALGGIDFDPASSAAANAVVQAEAYCTITENGYAQPWYGRVWLNPPYGKEDGETETNAVRWSRKLIAEYEEGRVEAAILLVKAALGYNWFEELWRLYPTCLLRERLSFVRPDGSNDGQSKHATALLYFGTDSDRFRNAFQSLGRIVLPD